MKKNLSKIFILGFFLFTNFIVFAQPGNNDGTGGLEGTDPPPAPINTWLIWLGIAAIVFAFYSFKTKRQQTV